jgi:glycosyltransferase involved in cell wall biosynthesis
MRILVVNHVIPFPPISGGDLRAYQLIKALAMSHDVTVVGFTCGAPVEPPIFPARIFEYPYETPTLWKEMTCGNAQVWRPAYEKLLNETEEPWSVSCMRSEGLEDLLRRVGRESFDLFVIHHSNMARFLPALPPDIPKILDFVDLHALMAERAAEAASSADGEAAWRDEEEARHEAERTRRFERHAASQCELCLVTSEHEADAARRLLGIEHIRVVPNGVDTVLFTPAESAPREGYILFTGTMNNASNAEAAHYFARKVLPLVRKQTPHARFHIVGADPGEEVKGLASDSVVVHGRVPSVVPYFQEATVAVVPLLRGGGTRLKILEAAACAKAVVSTTLGAEGLNLRPGVDIVLADSAETFAGEVARLLRDPARCRRLGRAARQCVQAYDWAGIGKRFCDLAAETARACTVGGLPNRSSRLGNAVMKR